MHLEAAEGFVARAGVKVDELLKPPVPAEVCNATYCPRCHAQFVLKEGVCSECGGRALVKFGKPG